MTSKIYFDTLTLKCHKKNIRAVDLPMFHSLSSWQVKVFTLPLVFRLVSSWSPGIPLDWSWNLHGIQQEFRFLIYSYYSISSPMWFRWTDKNSVEWMVEFSGTSLLLSREVIYKWSHVHICTWFRCHNLWCDSLSSTNTNDTMATNETWRPWPTSAPPCQPQWTTIEDDHPKTRTTARKQEWTHQNMHKRQPVPITTHRSPQTTASAHERTQTRDE
jgi:hypothetical protein